MIGSRLMLVVGGGPRASRTRCSGDPGSTAPTRPLATRSKSDGTVGHRNASQPEAFRISHAPVFTNDARSADTSFVTPRRIVLAIALTDVVSWALAIAGVSGAGGLASTPYVAADAVLEVVIIVGLLLLWRTVWIFAVVLSILGLLTAALHLPGGAVFFTVGAAQLVLLLLPPLRHALHARPLVPKH
jgi:hypothetical protein